MTDLEKANSLCRVIKLLAERVGAPNNHKVLMEAAREYAPDYEPIFVNHMNGKTELFLTPRR